MKRLVFLLVLASTNAMGQAVLTDGVWRPGSETEAGRVSGCPGGTCGQVNYGAPTVQNIAMYDTEFLRVEKDLPAYAPIGFVTNDKTNMEGTGFLISPCHVLTNEHVVYTDATEEQKKDMRVTFGVGKSSQAAFAFGVVGDVVEAGTGESTCEDFAVIELDKCVGDDYGYIDLLPLSIDQLLDLESKKVAVKSAGYPSTEDLSKISVDNSCTVFGMHTLDSEAYAHDCSSVARNSGSPIFFEKPKKNKLAAFGIVSAVTVTKDRSITDDTLLEGENAKDPSLRNKAVPISCIYERIKQFIPDPVQTEPAPPTPSP